MAYPLEPGGVDDYPVKVGSMLLTLVDPNPGFESAYNRWYERDHYYAGCMVGPYQLAGSRWVAPRRLKDLRWPEGDTAVANPTDAGSYVAIYWIEQGHHDEWNDWAQTQVSWLYSNGRGFAERKHTHTTLFDHIGAAYRDDDPTPVELALDRAYPGIVVAWFDAREGRTARSVEVYAFAPGLDAQAIEVTVERGVLKIAGERPAAAPRAERGVQVYASERPHGRFSRVLSLPDDVDTGKVEASYRDGVLRVSIGLLEAAQPQRIAVQ